MQTQRLEFLFKGYRSSVFQTPSRATIEMTYRMGIPKSGDCHKCPPFFLPPQHHVAH